jgi:hypothetical protein
VPIGGQLSNPFGTVEVNREDFSKLLDTKWSNGHKQALETGDEHVLDSPS